MKSKMKLWRRNAEELNLDATIEAGQRMRHQGRKNKAMFSIPEQPSGLLKALMQRVGLISTLTV